MLHHPSWPHRAIGARPCPPNPWVDAITPRAGLGRGEQSTEGCRCPLRMVAHGMGVTGWDISAPRNTISPCQHSFIYSRKDPGWARVHGGGKFFQEKALIANIQPRQNVLEKSKTVTAMSRPREGGCSRRQFSCGKSMLGAEPSKMSPIPPYSPLAERPLCSCSIVIFISNDLCQRGYVRVQPPLRGGCAQL